MSIKNYIACIKKHGAQTIIDTLAPYVTEPRKLRIEAVVETRINSIQLAMESPSDINNALAVVRTCEAMGVTQIHIIQSELDTQQAEILQSPYEYERAPRRSVRRRAKLRNNLLADNLQHAPAISRGAFYWVNIHFYSTWPEFLAKIQQENLLLIGGDIKGDCMISAVPIEQPLCLIVGNEHRGLSDVAKKACQTLYRIPMYGWSESLNLSVSAAISLYDTTTRKRQLLKKSGDLTPEQQLITRAQYYLNSVDQRMAALLNDSFMN